MWIVGLTVDCCINPPASFATELEAQVWVVENNIRWDRYYIWQEQHQQKCNKLWTGENYGN